MGTEYTKVDLSDSPILGLRLENPPWKIPRGGFVVFRNLRVQDGQIQTLGGKTLITQTGDGNQITHISLPTFNGNYQVGVVGTNANLYQLANNLLAAMNAAAYAAAAGTPWEMAQLLDKAYFLQPSNPIQVLENAGVTVTDLVAAAGLGTAPIGYTMTDFYNHLIVGNIVGPQPQLIPAPQAFIGSGLANDKDWSLGLSTSESRSFLLPTGNDSIRVMRKLGDYLIGYKAFSMHQISYIAPNILVYSEEVLSARTGACGNQVVVFVPAQGGNGDQHYFVGQDNIYMFDGTINPIGHRIWDNFKTLVMPKTWTQIVGWYHEIAKEIWWGFASAAAGTGAIDTALVYDILDDSFSYQDWPFTAGGYMLNGITGQDRWIDHPEDWQHILPAGRPWVTVSGLEDLSPFVGDATGKLYQFEGTPTPDYAALAQTWLDAVGNDSAYKICNGMRLDLGGLTPGKPFEVWGRGLAELSDYNTQPFLKLASLSGGSRVDFFLSGRYFDFQFRCPAGGTFTLGAFEARYKNRGLR